MGDAARWKAYYGIEATIDRTLRECECDEYYEELRNFIVMLLQKAVNGDFDTIKAEIMEMQLLTETTNEDESDE